MSRSWLALAAVYGLLGVILGAFGAHALRESLTTDALIVWHTAVEYQFWHALALGLVGLLARSTPSRLLDAAGACFAVGVLVFSGSLYALTLSGVRVLGAITPLGGLAFIAGWVLLLVTQLRRR